MNQKSRRQELFDHWSEYYNQSVLDNMQFPFQGYDKVLATIVEQAEIKSSHVVLDVGIGTGNLTRLLPLPSEQIWGVDFSVRMLDKARESLPGIHLLKIDLLNRDWFEKIIGPFDRILSSYTLHEFKDEIKCSILSNLVEKLSEKDSKVIIGDISFPDEVSFNKAHQFLKGRWDEDEYYWCAETMINLLEQEGFIVEYTQVSSCAGIYLIRQSTGQEKMV
ncbi:MAG: class I SAM-dependent DNA methyltransferase [Anaerolineales bacterium]